MNITESGTITELRPTVRLRAGSVITPAVTREPSAMRGALTRVVNDSVGLMPGQARTAGGGRDWEQRIGGLAARVAQVGPMRWLQSTLRDALGAAPTPHVAARRSSNADEREHDSGPRRHARSVWGDAPDAWRSDEDDSARPRSQVAALAPVDCSTQLASRRTAAGGSNNAAMVEIREAGAEHTYRLKDFRAPKAWLAMFERELAESLDLDSNFYPAMEVTMSQIFKATGLQAPLIRIGKNCQSVLGAENLGHRQGALYGMTKYDFHYRNLGEFLLSKEGREQILSEFEPGTDRYFEVFERYEKLVGHHKDAVERQKKLLEGKKFYEITSTDRALVSSYQDLDKKRFSALEALNRMLPSRLACDQEEHYLMSRFVNTWDHLNYRMENFGYTRRNDQWVGETIDFDTTGPLGYMGTPKSMGHRLADTQRPPALFKLQDRGASYDDFSADFRPDLIGLESQPYGEQSRTSIEGVMEVMQRALRYEDAMERLSGDPAYRSVLASGYRLKRLSNETIVSIVDRNWHDAPSEFNLTKPGLITILQTRRHDFLNQIGMDAIEQWASGNKERAQAIDSEIADGLRELGLPNEHVRGPL